MLNNNVKTMFLHYFIVLKNTNYGFYNVLKGILYLLEYFQNLLDVKLTY